MSINPADVAFSDSELAEYRQLISTVVTRADEVEDILMAAAVMTVRSLLTFSSAVEAIVRTMDDANRGVTMNRCLCCGRSRPENAHWPVAVGMGGRKDADKLPQLPLCLYCHRADHGGNRETRLRIIELAPQYWKSIGKWDEWRELFETWLMGWELKTGTRTNHWRDDAT